MGQRIPHDQVMFGIPVIALRDALKSMGSSLVAVPWFSLTRILRRACKRTKVDYVSPHKAGRHAFAARFLKDGNSLKALMEAGGWSSFSSVLRYAHLEAK